VGCVGLGEVYVPVGYVDALVRRQSPLFLLVTLLLDWLNLVISFHIIAFVIAWLNGLVPVLVLVLVPVLVLVLVLHQVVSLPRASLLLPVLLPRLRVLVRLSFFPFSFALVPVVGIVALSVVVFRV
jgi:hypothetical protein